MPISSKAGRYTCPEDLTKEVTQTFILFNINPDIVKIEAKYNPVRLTLYFGWVRIQIGITEPSIISSQKK